MRIALLALFLCFTASTTVYAQSGFGSAGGVSGSGVLTTSSNPDGSYSINAISGTGVDGLLDPFTFNNNDNLIFPSGDSFVDGNGFAFIDTMGDTDYTVDIFSLGGSYYASISEDGDSFALPISFTLDSSDPGDMSAFFNHSHNEFGLPPTFSFSFSADAGAGSGSGSGSPTPAATPEPSSFVLLGTGLIAAAGEARRRLRRA